MIGLTYLALLGQSALPWCWSLEGTPIGDPNLNKWELTSRQVAFEGQSLIQKWKMVHVGGARVGVTRQGKPWILDIPYPKPGRFKYSVYGPSGALAYSHTFPANYFVGPAKSSEDVEVEPSVFLNRREGGHAGDRSELLLLTTNRRWLSFPGARHWTHGRNSGELFFAKLWGHFFDPNAKLLTAWVVDKRTGSSRKLTATQFRSILWPSARIAYDKYGPGAFFGNFVERPGYPNDPAYVISRIYEQYDEEQAVTGKSAVIFPNGQVVETEYHGSPLIATTKRGKTMFVLTDDSYYNKMGVNEREVLHLMKVDPKHGLVRVASVKNATGVSYAFAE